MNHTKSFFPLFIVVLCTFASCHRDNKIRGQVIIQELSDPGMLNPVNFTDANSGYIMRHLFQSLMTVDFKTQEVIPLLAESKPLIEKRNNAPGMLITYRIHKEAKFDNGDPVTGKDIAFTVKVVKNPKVNSQRNRPYFEFIEDVLLYPEDPKKLTFVCKEVYILSEVVSGDIYALPSKIYDPKGLMENFTVPQLNNFADSLSKNEKIIEFANEFNSEKYQRDSAFVSGSGPYALSKWITGQKLILVRKTKWWGDELKDKNSMFEAHPEKIIYQVINDQSAALTALKAGSIDVMRSIKSKDFMALSGSEKVKEKFNLYTPASYHYGYLGFNFHNPVLADKLVRQAISQIVDVPKIISTVYYDLGVRVVGPVNPLKTKSYNNAIPFYNYEPEKAKKLLSDAGWKDSNNDGVLDKMIGGKKTEMEFSILYNSGNDERKAIAMIFQEEARKVGMKVSIVAVDFPLYLKKQKEHDFDMIVASWYTSPVPDDFKQTFHSSSYNSGSNFGGFGTPGSDALIDSMRIELDPGKYNEMSKRFQVICHEEAPYVFIYSQKEKIAISKKYSNAEPSVIKPGYFEAGFLEDTH